MTTPPEFRLAVRDADEMVQLTIAVEDALRREREMYSEMMRLSSNTDTTVARIAILQRLVDAVHDCPVDPEWLHARAVG